MILELVLKNEEISKGRYSGKKGYRCDEHAQSTGEQQAHSADAEMRPGPWFGAWSGGLDKVAILGNLGFFIYLFFLWMVGNHLSLFRDSVC